MVECGKINLLENEKQIVELARNDVRDFETLYNFYFPKIYGYVFARVGRHEIAEDLVAQTFLKAFSNLKKYTYQGHTFGAWVYKIATNLLIDYYRKQSRGKEVDLAEAEGVASQEAPIRTDIEKREAGEQVRRILSQLPAKYQEILHLRFFADMSNQEIASVMQISANNCRVLTFRALKNFKEIYDKIS